MMATSNPQTRFLESQASRTHALKTKYSSRTESLAAIDSFWHTLKREIASWRSALAELGPPESEADKRRVREQLTMLQNQLGRLRKTCLADGIISRDERESSLIPPETLPLPDMRRLHNDFGVYQEELETIKSRLLPKGKFIFKRYREAKKSKETSSASKVSALNPLVPDLVKGHQAPLPPLWDNEGTVCDMKHKAVVLHLNGSIEIEGVMTDIVHGPDTPVLLRDLHHCNVIIHGSYPSIHLVSVSDSEVVVHQPVSRTIHVTACHRTSMTATSQQLRLHESTNLICHVTVSAGAIMEESQRIVFCSPNQLDVKDFDWLRSNVPSPNFSLEKTTETPPIMNPGQAVASTTGIEKPRGAKEQSGPREIPEDNDDDEL